MCTTCGCSEHSHTHTHTDENGNTVIHTHEHEPTTKTVTVEEDILARNNHVAQHNREHLRDKHILALNFVSSPGSGKTELLCATVRAMGENAGVYVIEGDQETSNDADRIRATGAPAVQINTGKGCHLDAEMVHEAIHALAPMDNSVLFIENVGNLVCPAAFDLGEAHKVVILSVTEGDTTKIAISPDDVNDMRTYGVLKMYKGAPIVVLPQSFETEDNETKVIDPSFCYIVPSSGYKIARLVFEGGTVVDEFKNKDRSMEISVYQKVGVAILHNNNWAIYENTALN